MEGWWRIMGDATDTLAGEAASDLRVDIARASAARGVLPGVRTSSSIAVSVRLGVARESALSECCNTLLLDERLLDLFVVGFGVVGLGGSSFLAIFAGGASAGAVKLAAAESTEFASNALRDILSFSIARMTSCASNALAFLFVPPVRIVDNLSKLSLEIWVFKKSFQ